MKTTVLLVALVLAFGMTASADIVVNGGFETGDLTGWTEFGNYAPYSAVTGLTCPGGPDKCTPNSGNYALFLAQSADSGGVSQTIATVPGDTYRLDYYLTVGPGGYGNGTGTYTFSLDSTVFASGTDASASGWTPETWSWTASGSSAVLTFTTAEYQDWIGLDDISVTAQDETPTPEPGSIALSAFGLLMAAAARKRFFAARS